MLVVIVDLAWPDRDRIVITGVASVGIVVLMALVVDRRPVRVRRHAHRHPAPAPTEVFGGAYVRDGLTALLDLLLLSIALLTVLFGPDYLRPRGLPAAEFTRDAPASRSPARCSSAARATCCCSSSRSSCWCCPATCSPGYAKRDGLSTEGAIKYFLLGSFSSAIFLFGLVLDLRLHGHDQHPRGRRQSITAIGSSAGFTALAPGLLMGLALLTTGAAFKIAAVPFHYWTPDAYQGSPTPVTGYLSVGPKVAAFALILRLFVEALGAAQGRLDADRRHPGRGHHDAGQPRRADPGQHQAHAGVQLDRPHRLHPGRPRRVRRRPGRLAG